MQISIINKKEEPLLSRTMVKAMLEFEKATPSCQEAASLIASNLKIDEKLIAIKHIYNLFGNRKAETIAYIYKDEAKKQFMETRVKEKKEKAKKVQK